MNGIHIVATGSALPKRTVTNHDLSKIVDTSDEWIVTRTGIESRHICEEETGVSLAIEAAKAAIDEALAQAMVMGEDTETMSKEVFSIEEIGAVVVATATPDYAFPSNACLVQKALNLPKETMAFDLSAACSGFLYGMEVCRGLLRGSKKKYALLIGSEQLSRIVDFTDRSTCILFGDGAGAAILRLDDSLYVHKAWADGNIDPLSCKGVGNNDAKLSMDGKEVFKFAVRVLKQGIDSVLNEADLTIEDIDYVVCHQANRRIIEHVMKKYNGQEDKFYINIQNVANTSAASIPLALDEMRKKQLLKSGMKVIFVGFGAGFTWSSALVTV